MGDVTLSFVRDSRVLANENVRTMTDDVSWRVRFDRDNIRVDGMPQWIDLETDRPARVPDRVADIEFGRDYGNGFSEVAKHFEGRPIAVVLNKTTKWKAGLRELDKALIYALAFVLRPISNPLDRLHPDNRTYGLSRVTGPDRDYRVVQDLRRNEVIREIWTDPTQRHRIMRVVELLNGQPGLQLDYEYADESWLPSQWTVMRLEGDRIVDFATVECTSSKSEEPISPATFVLSGTDVRPQGTMRKSGGAITGFVSSWPAIVVIVVVAFFIGKFVVSALSLRR